MSRRSKVIWSEGMLMRPQHLQQQERHLAGLVHARCAPLQPYSWGLLECRIDSEMLSAGKIGIRTCRGIFADGTPFAIPEDDVAPPPLDVPLDVEGVTVGLSLSTARAGASEVTRSPTPDASRRYVSIVYDVEDSSQPDSIASVEIANLNLHLILGDAGAPGAYVLPIARIAHRRSDLRVVLDEDYIPTCLDCTADPRLSRLIAECHALLVERAAALARRITPTSATDILHLQVLNRYEQLLVHVRTRPYLHPEELYKLLVQLVAEISTFSEPTRRIAKRLRPYTHDALTAVFSELMISARKALGG